MRSLFFVAVGWLLPIAVLFFATPVLVGNLGFAGFGVYTLAGALVAAGASLDLGIGALAVRQLARSRGDDSAFQRRAAAVNTAFVGLATLGVILVWLFSAAIARALQWDRSLSPIEAVAAARWTGIWLCFAYLNVALANCLRAIERFDFLTLLSSGSVMAIWTAAAVGSQWGLGPVGVIALAAGVSAAQFVLGCVAYLRLFGCWPRLGRWQGFDPGAVRFAGGAFVGQATSLATYHADKAIISALLGTAQAGMYAAASNVANKPLGLIAALAGMLFPRVAALEGAGRGFRSARTYLAASRMLLAASTLLLVVGWVLAADFIWVWLGPAVPDSVTVSLRTLLVAFWITTMSVAPASALAGRGNTHRGAMFAFLGGAVTVIGCWVLVPRIGIVGAAVAALLGMSQAAVFELWAHREAQARAALSRFMLRRTALAITVSAVGAAAAAAILQATLPLGWFGLFAAALAAASVFAALWLGVGLAVREERVLLGRAIRWLRSRRR